MKEAYNYILRSNKLIDNDYIVVGVSGGPDSMALLHLLITLREKIKINIVCAHVNHNVRKESNDEKKFVEDYCRNNNVIFEYMKIENYGDDNFQNEARTIRYKFFEDTLKKYNSKILFTAHHGDDLIETILMRLVRGSTLKGYAGFSIEKDMITYKIIRPLIFYTKSDILEYNKKNGISYVLDGSNDKDKYTRNRYRHNVLPFLKKEDINVNAKFLKFSETLLECNEYIDKITSDYIKEVYKENSIDIEKFLKLELFIQKRIINYILEMIYSDDLMLINDTHTELIINLINGNKPNAILRLPNGLLVTREYGYLKFNKEEDKYSDYEILLEKDVVLPNNMKLYFVKAEESDSNYICRLNSKEIKPPLYVRNRRQGDKICVKGMLGSKKVKDIFINSKIGFENRRIWPIVLDSNNNIVWIPGLKKSKYNKDINEKYDIIIKYNVKEEK